MPDYRNIGVCPGTHHKGCACHEAAHDAEIERLRARVAELASAQRWVPVEESLPPIDATIDVWAAGRRYVDCCRQDTGDGWLWADADGDEATFADDLPTHWMPRPPAPEAKP